jgi:hypothetical protein
MNYVSLDKGSITVRSGDDVPHTFNPDEHVRIGDLIAESRVFSFMRSSSCDFPDEYGFDENFEVDAILAKAVEHARRKLAVAVHPTPIGDLAAAVEKAAKEYLGGFPLSLLFVKSGKKGQDIMLPFEEEKDLEYFTAGIRYTARLAACNGSGPWKESSSATPNGARTAGRTASTSASRPTRSHAASPSTAGSAKGVAPSARTKKGSSPKTRRGKGA